MKKLIVGILILFSCISCGGVYFSSPLPEKGLSIKSFVGDVVGNYSDTIINVSIYKNGVTVFGENFSLTKKEPKEGEVLVKFYNNNYFANFNIDNHFFVIMAKFYDNKLALYTLNADSYSISRLKKVINVAVLDSCNDSYLISPTKKEFDDLVNYDMFEVLTVLTRPSQ